MNISKDLSDLSSNSNFLSHSFSLGCPTCYLNEGWWQFTCKNCQVCDQWKPVTSWTYPIQERKMKQTSRPIKNIISLMSVCNLVAVNLKVLNTQKRPSKDGPHKKDFLFSLPRKSLFNGKGALPLVQL